MLILALDTASHLCSAAVFDTEAARVIGACTEDIGRGHAERMMAVIDAALEEAGAGFADLGRIGVTVGPGSFTGIRVGVATARGLALALNVPAVPVTTLAAIAAAADPEKAGGRPVMALIDARRGEVYAQLFAAPGEPLDEPQAVTPAAAAKLAEARGAALIGSGAPLVAELLVDSLPILGTAAAASITDVARLAARAPEGRPPAPLYLRSPDAKVQAGFALARQK
jgi:tRNA threonylcarbamoyl adenosine modification protein YeaZ